MGWCGDTRSHGQHWLDGRRTGTSNRTLCEGYGELKNRPQPVTADNPICVCGDPQAAHPGGTGMCTKCTCDGYRVTADDRTSDTAAVIEAAAKVIANVICNVPMRDLSSRGGSLKAAEALASAGLLANNTRHDTIIEAAKKWRAARAEFFQRKITEAHFTGIESVLAATVDGIELVAAEDGTLDAEATFRHVQANIAALDEVDP